MIDHLHSHPMEPSESLPCGDHTLSRHVPCLTAAEQASDLRQIPITAGYGSNLDSVYALAVSARGLWLLVLSLLTPVWR